MECIRECLIKQLEIVLSLLKSGKMECDDEQAEMALSIISHKAVSKEVACNEVLHWSRSKFNEYIAKGLMPKGRKVRGFTELRWYVDELVEAKRKCELIK